MRSRALVGVGVVLALALGGCPKKKDDGGETLTMAEAQQAVEESTLSSQAESL